MGAEAELLRRAAADMRAKAKAATPGPWVVLWNAVAFIDTVADPNDPTGQTPMQQPEKVADASERDRQHIASWHPAVALAVADWLEAAAAENDSAEDSALGFLNFVGADAIAALAVANAYLGESA